MKYFLTLIGILSVIFIYSCKPKYHVKVGEAKVIEVLEYKAAVTKINDLVHTKLSLEPDFKNKELKGTASITLKPHFYPTDSLTLNAKYMRIEKVGMAIVSAKSTDNALDKTASTNALKYTYDSLFLRIKLDKTYTKDESYTIIIEYTAQPEKCKSEGGTSIKEDKGIYFINPDSSDKYKPTQIWTQGETEAASCWFPTIDAPNQKTTQEILVTVPDQFRTISNGLLISSEKLPNGKRLDYWKNDKPHAPYLFALVIGDFVQTKDKWRDIDVNYYMDPAYAPYAQTVFGHTPEMLEFFSTRLGYIYPWQKFDQVVVHDFVSGAMENTGCVVHFDKLNHNNREHLDNTYEDVISHELFHHWFGDLLTCESWSNIPLNESFATYGEYLWNEHKYGRNQADLKFDEFLSAYLSEAADKQVPMIRFYYSKRDDLFDRHSYQKGGAILHMLRKYVGDEAFFKSLKLYLTRNAYKTVEINDLRMTFEEVTGEDLNWFFNQWFMKEGHPELEVKHQVYNGSGELYGITIIQKSTVFKLPVDIDIYTAKGIERHRIIIEKDSQTFGLKSKSKPLAVIFDAEHQLLADITETKSIAAWEDQLKYAVLATHKEDALIKLNTLQPDKGQRVTYNGKYLKDSFWHLRETALSNLNDLDLTNLEVKPVLFEIENMALNDTKSDVRAACIPFLENQKDEDRLNKMLNDSSYYVCSKALQAMGTINKEVAYDFANAHREEKNTLLQDYIFYTLGKYSKNNEIDFFINHLKTASDKSYSSAITGLNYLTLYNQLELIDEALVELNTMAASNIQKERAIECLKDLQTAATLKLFYLNLYKKIDKENKVYYTKLAKLMEANKKKIELVLYKYEPKLAD
ncbi:MAG: M1 family metallopeptidase [bacterium]|nr:M1 family metallopeptidase [bacterium]